MRGNSGPAILAVIVAAIMMLLIGLLFGLLPLLFCLIPIAILAFVVYQSAIVSIAARAAGTGGVTAGNINWPLLIALVIGTFVLAVIVAVATRGGSVGSGGGGSTSSTPGSRPLREAEISVIIQTHSADALADTNIWRPIATPVSVKVDRAAGSPIQHVAVLDFCRSLSVRVSDGVFGPPRYRFAYPLQLRSNPNSAWPRAGTGRIPSYTAAKDAVGKPMQRNIRSAGVVVELKQDHDRLAPDDGNRFIHLYFDGVVDPSETAIIRTITKAPVAPGTIAYWGPVPKGQVGGRDLRVRGRLTFLTADGTMQTNGMTCGQLVPPEAFANPAKAPVVWYSGVNPLDPNRGPLLAAEAPVNVGLAAGELVGHEAAPLGAFFYIMTPPDWPPVYIAVCWEIR